MLTHGSSRVGERLERRDRGRAVLGVGPQAVDHPGDLVAPAGRVVEEAGPRSSWRSPSSAIVLAVRKSRRASSPATAGSPRRAMTSSSGEGSAIRDRDPQMGELARDPPGRRRALRAASPPSRMARETSEASPRRASAASTMTNGMVAMAGSYRSGRWPGSNHSSTSSSVRTRSYRSGFRPRRRQPPSRGGEVGSRLKELETPQSSHVEWEVAPTSQTSRRPRPDRSRPTSRASSRGSRRSSKPRWSSVIPPTPRM